MLTRILDRCLATTAVMVLMLGVAGCDQTSTPPPPSHGETTSTPPPRPSVPDAGGAKVNVENGETHVEVKKPGDTKPAAEVNVVPGAGVDVKIDRDKIQQNAEERRERRESRDSAKSVSP
jgi:hypothetical protein